MSKIIRKFLKVNELDRQEKIPSGSLILDFLLEGGIPVGKIIEFWGSESSGKSTFALTAANNFLQKGYNVLYIDLEDSLSYEYVKKLGINENLEVWKNPTTKEVVYSILGLEKEESLIGQYRLIIIDSISTFRDEGNPHYGSAKLISSFLSYFLEINRKLPFSEKTTLIFTNQIRANIGSFGNSQTSSGGYALKHYTHLRIRFDKSKIDPIKKTFVINISIPKSKTCLPFSSASILFDYKNSRVITGDEILTIAQILNLCEKENGVYKFRDVGIEVPELKQEARIIRFLDENKDKIIPVLREKMEEYIKERNNEI